MTRRATVLPGDPVVSTENLSKHFGPSKAVDNLTITVPRGTITGFIGPNGSGKSTTIRMLLGLLRPTFGAATVLGEDIRNPGAYLPRVGAVSESPVFYPSLSGRKNLEALAELGGHPRSRVDRLLESVGLDKRAKDPVRKYSLGMKQRLGLAMALLPDPELVILDEPANGLDPLGVIGLREQLRDMREQGRTLFLSSHLLGELEHVCDWLVMILDGKAVYNGSPQELAAKAGSTGAANGDHQPSLEESFLAMLMRGDRS